MDSSPRGLNLINKDIVSNCCKTTICGLYSLADLDEFSLGMKNEVYNISKKRLRDLANGYRVDPLCNVRDTNTVKRLCTYLEAIRLIKDQEISGNGSCMDQETVQCLVEKIKGILGKNCKTPLSDIFIDDSTEDVWAMAHPHCRSYEEWNKWTKYVCGKLSIELKTETKSQNLIFEISRKTVTPNVLMAISAHVDARTLDMEITRDDDEVDVDFSLLSENVELLNLTKGQYNTIVKDNNLSYDIVKTIYDEGLSLEIDENNMVNLVTPVDKYNLADISGNITVDYLKRFGMEATINKNDLLQDFK